MHSLPEDLSRNIGQLVTEAQIPASKLAATVKKISDHFQTPLSVTPWEIPSAEIAYLSYFLPLNFLRLQSVLRDAIEMGFFSEDLNPPDSTYIDFGAGPGTTALALQSLLPQFKKGICVENLLNERKYFERLAITDHDIQWRQDCPQAIVHMADLAIFSYSLNELERFPKWMFDLPNLIFIEPSTSETARKLQDVRQQLIDQGFSIWAPCTHQQGCPLLIHSQKDWCHHRIGIELPSWYQKIEDHLPMKNDNITFSYLLASKRPAPLHPENTFRMTGDMKKEKGKSRIMACRGDQREFLSWLKKQGPAPPLNRGDILTLSEFEKKSDEIRPT